MTVDTELETWRREWLRQTEPLPELKRKIKRQNLRAIAGAAVICACLVFSTIEALRTRSSFMSGVAEGIWFSSLFLGSYTWWVRRGTWKPAAQTTVAYLELSYTRAVANARTIRFSFYFLLLGTVLCAAVVAWDWRALSAREPVTILAIVMELFLFRYLGQRKKREIEETKKLLNQTKE